MSNLQDSEIKFGEISSNSSTEGASISLMRSKLTLSEVTIKKNTSGGDTAGIYIFGSELILGDCRFEEQTSVEGAFINAQTSSSIYDTGSEFYQGVASNIGGTIRAIDTQIIMNKSNFTENSAD